MVDNQINADVLVVGAGLSGLLAARVLSAHGLKVTIVDKGRSVGGRLATRRIGEGLADHGAQFFTVRSPEFQTLVDEWLASGLVYQWASGFSDGQDITKPFDGHPRYVVKGGMNALAKHLAAEIDQKATIRVGVKMNAVTATTKGWHAQDEACDLYNMRAVLMTPPVPQSLKLLGMVLDQLKPDDRAALERIAYAPCVAGLFRVQGTANLPEPGAIQSPNEPISWMADNQRKGISPNATVITVHAGTNYSQQLWDMPENVALAMLQAALQPYLESAGSFVEAQLKRWRYALPTTLHPERYLLAEGVPALAFAGDAFGESRVEGAALSGLAAGAALAAKLVS